MARGSRDASVYPIISCMQKIALYETATRIFVVGSNSTQTKYRVLKIDRTEPRELLVVDDKIEYTQKEIRELLMMIDLGNRSRQSQKSQMGLSHKVSAFGIVGFVRFLEGYYIILITKRRRIALIGHHPIYKIEDTTMIYIPNDVEKNHHPDEARYLKLFQTVDLSSNFYFSYSYDLTHILQYNLLPPQRFMSGHPKHSAEKSTKDTSQDVETAESLFDNLKLADDKCYSLTKQRKDPFSPENMAEEWAELHSREQFHATGEDDSGELVYGVKMKPNWKFVWNSHLLEPVDLHPDWLLYIIHGFIGQSNISVYNRPLYLTLIARRSQKFAGTRFLKRGANWEGHVANEVETEQIVHDASVSSLTAGHFTAFVQMRGSIPFQWSQDTSKMVPKPPIMLDLADPYCYIAGLHFNQLLRRYGAPILILNLVKKREQKRHESMLSEEYINAVNYLNQFLPPQHRIEYIGFDMAQVNKLKEANVLGRLADIAYYAVKRTGIFQSHPRYYCQELHPPKRNLTAGGVITESGAILQTGIVRVNCVDCLDRTNTAQFALGKCALAFQLYALGVLENPTLEFDSDSVRMLEELYEDHGDTLALQYGGSQLVHRIKTYRKIAPLSSHSRDIMQTLSRYYSNTFSDADKQNAINLFLGVYKAYSKYSPLWEMMTDYYLHNAPAAGLRICTCQRPLYTDWCGREIVTCLPRAFDEVYKGSDNSLLEVIKTYKSDERIDGYYEQYRPYELTVIGELHDFTMGHSIREFMPNFATDYSPFCVRVRPGKRRESVGIEKPPNPSITGISSTSSSSASDVESGDSSDDEDHFLPESEESSSADSSVKQITFSSLLTTTKDTYGFVIHDAKERDLALYERYVNFGKTAGMPQFLSSSKEESRATLSRIANFTHKSKFSKGSIYEVPPPAVSQESLAKYAIYALRGKRGAEKPAKPSLKMYAEYMLAYQEATDNLIAQLAA